METSASWLDAGNIYSRVVLYGKVLDGRVVFASGWLPNIQEGGL